MAYMDASTLFSHHQLPGDLACTNVDADVDQQHLTMVDPQLAIPWYSYDAVDDRPADQFIFSEPTRDLPMDKTDKSMVFFGVVDAANQRFNKLEMHVGNSSQVDTADAATTPSLDTSDFPPSCCKSLVSNQSSAASVSSASSCDQKCWQHSSRKLEQQQHIKNKPPPVSFQPCQQAQLLPPVPPTKAAKPSRSVKNPRQAKKSRASQPIVIESETEHLDNPKRHQALERNRLTASKCRQRKKNLTQALEETKADLEKRRRALQGIYNSLLEEMSKVKNQLMLHSGCRDANIDNWIEREASRFVYRDPLLQTNAWY
jgi:hypothetical protein